jgi:hypothetical protein
MWLQGFMPGNAHIWRLRNTPQVGRAAMEKGLCYATMGVSGVLLAVFLLDLLLGVPFGRVSGFVDILAILTCGGVFYLGWDCYQDLK